MPPRRSVIIIELAGYGRRICLDGLRSSYDVFFLSALEFLPALVRDFFKGLCRIFLGHCIAQSLTAIAAHIVHADRCDGLHSRIDSGGTDRKSAAAADADDADAVSVHKRAGAKKVHGGTEIFDECFWRSYGTRLPAALAIVGGVESQGYESRSAICWAYKPDVCSFTPPNGCPTMIAGDFFDRSMLLGLYKSPTMLMPSLL